MATNQSIILTPELRMRVVEAVKNSTFVQSKVDSAKAVLEQMKKKANSLSNE